ncbi:MAG: DUF1707 SHOCT-like domain-containing protein [Nocardioidaceae bacterium]
MSGQYGDRYARRGGQNGPEVRIGDAERDAAISALGEHYAAGRLTKDEFDERSAQANAARTNADLWPLFADLPRPEATRAAGQAQRGRDRVSSAPCRPGWRTGVWWAPVLMVVIALVVLTHLPWIVLLVVGWFWFARMGRHWSRHRYWHERYAGRY